MISSPFVVSEKCVRAVTIAAAVPVVTKNVIYKNQWVREISDSGTVQNKRVALLYQVFCILVVAKSARHHSTHDAS
jgi:hypothetical protein